MTAETLIAKLEKLPLGEPWAAALAAAAAAVDADRALADAAVFPPEVIPVSLPTQHQYVRHTGNWSAIGYDRHALELHGRCIRSHIELAAALRGVECLEDIAAAAARQATPTHHLETHAAAGARASGIAVARYKLGVAAQIAAVDAHELGDAARRLLACEALSVRIAAVTARHEAHEVAEIERAAAASVAEESVHRERQAEAAAADADPTRLARVRALEQRLRQRKRDAARAGTLASRTRLEYLHVGDELHPAAEVLAAVAQMTPEQLAVYEIALDSEVA